MAGRDRIAKGAKLISKPWFMPCCWCTSFLGGLLAHRGTLAVTYTASQRLRRQRQALVQIEGCADELLLPFRLWKLVIFDTESAVFPSDIPSITIRNDELSSEAAYSASFWVFNDTANRKKMGSCYFHAHPTLLWRSNRRYDWTTTWRAVAESLVLLADAVFFLFAVR